MANNVNVTTSSNIYISINGTKVAGVQSYSAKYSRDSKDIDSFGTDEAIGYIRGKKKYSLDLTRVYLEDTALKDGIDFYKIADSDFSVIIEKNGRRIQYADCVVTSISEDGALNDAIKEKLSVTARTRKVL